MISLGGGDPEQPWWAKGPDKPWWGRGSTAPVVPMPRDTNTQPYGGPLEDPEEFRKRVASAVPTAIDFTPILGDIKAALWDAPQQFMSGHPGWGLVSLASVIPGIPNTSLLGRFAKKVHLGGANDDMVREMYDALESSLGKYNADPLEYIRVVPEYGQYGDMIGLARGEYADGGIIMRRVDDVARSNDVHMASNEWTLENEGVRGYAVDNIRDLTQHEIGHAMHDRMPGGLREFGRDILGGDAYTFYPRDPLDEANLRAMSISQYAAKNTPETIAEGWTALHKGEIIHDPVIRGLLDEIINGIRR